MNFKESIAILVPVYQSSAAEFVTLIMDLMRQEGEIPFHVYFALEKGSVKFSIENLINDCSESKCIFDFTILHFEGRKGLGYALNFSLKSITQNIVIRHDVGDRMFSNRVGATLDAFKKKPNVAV
ncbi:hypothetical protein N8090_02365, partial [Amylibacter sp.]|nr:hypothetical protein [Amylibacter sp.]